MSNSRRFRRRHRHVSEPAPGDPNEPVKAAVLRLAARKIRRESPTQYRVIQVFVMVTFVVPMVLMLILLVLVLVYRVVVWALS